MKIKIVLLPYALKGKEALKENMVSHLMLDGKDVISEKAVRKKRKKGSLGPRKFALTAMS